MIQSKPTTKDYDFIVLDEVKRQEITTTKGPAEVINFTVLAYQLPILKMQLFINKDQEGREWSRIPKIFSVKLNKYFFNKDYDYNLQMRINDLVRDHLINPTPPYNAQPEAEQTTIKVPAMNTKTVDKDGGVNWEV